MMNRSLALRALSLPLLLALGACSGTDRFSGPVARGGPGTPVYTQPSLPPVERVESAPVTAQPLPPPAGSYPSGGYPTEGYPVETAQPGALPAPTDPFFDPTAGGGQPPVTGTTQPPVMSGGGGQVATLGGAPTRPAPASRDRVVGTWNAREATGGSCRVQLSSSPALDLYRATATGCSNRDLQQVNAWDYRDGEVYLYQRGGTVVARLRGDASGLSGAVTRSGAGLSMSR